MPSFLRCCCASRTSDDRNSFGEQRVNSDALQSSTVARADGPQAGPQVGQDLGTSGARTTLSKLSCGDTVTDTRAEPQKSLPSTEWVVGLDFGTTFSGFAYAKVSDDPDVNVFMNWPKKGNETFYCKTLTALYYRPDEGGSHLKCSSWGYLARSDYSNNRNCRHDHSAYLTNFKLLLNHGLSDSQEATCIPAQLTVMSVITDYLRLIGETALSVIQSHEGETNFNKDLVQWCVTVPSIWDEKAKQQMKECMVNAGLVGVGGMDSVKVVLEPEAASFNCHQVLRQDPKEMPLLVHDKILVVDVGGGTVDIVVQEIVGAGKDYQVRELTESSGGLRGGTFVDDSFLKFASKKIPCLKEFLEDDLTYKTRLLRDWEQIKYTFDAEEELGTYPKDITLHKNLEQKWEAYEEKRGKKQTDCSILQLWQRDIKSIFDPVVKDILGYVTAQLEQVPDIKVMFVVGGFAESAYLMQRIRARFNDRVQRIVKLQGPGSAIMHGAVLLAMRPHAIVSRFAKKTYGVRTNLLFESDLDPLEFQIIENGKKYCDRRFSVFVRKGDCVEFDKCVTKVYFPLKAGQTDIGFELWSSTDKDPRHTGVVNTTKEGEFRVSVPDYSNASEWPKFDVSMFFGRSNIEVVAVGKFEGSEAGNLVVPVKYYL